MKLMIMIHCSNIYSRYPRLTVHAESSLSWVKVGKCHMLKSSGENEDKVQQVGELT
jgi:hypothetical protein